MSKSDIVFNFRKIMNIFSENTFNQKTCTHVYALITNHEVKIAGYKVPQKKINNEANVLSHCDRTSLVMKDLSYGKGLSFD